MSITSCGSVVVWSDVLSSTEEVEEDVAVSSSFQKEFIKNVKLSEQPLRVIKSVDGYVMICDSVGRIRFFDKDLKILFWCPSNDLIDSVVSISFDLGRKPDEVEGGFPKTFSIRDFFVRKKILY